jgi:hypothetical protein
MSRATNEKNKTAGKEEEEEENNQRNSTCVQSIVFYFSLILIRHFFVGLEENHRSDSLRVCVCSTVHSA